MFPVFPMWFFLLVFGLPAGVLGVVAGGLASSILRKHWDLRAALMDAFIATGVWVICSYVITAIAMSFGTLQRGAGPGPWLDYTIATASVVVRHLILRYSTLRIGTVHRSSARGGSQLFSLVH